MMEYTAPEGDGSIQLCAVITSHNGAPRPFIISATTQDGTAGNISMFLRPLLRQKPYIGTGIHNMIIHYNCTILAISCCTRFC